MRNIIVCTFIMKLSQYRNFREICQIQKFLSGLIFLIRIYKNKNLGKDWTQKQMFDSDIYALGMVFYYLANNKDEPYDFEDIDTEKDANWHLKVFEKVKKTAPKPSASSIGKELDALIMRMISKNPNKRPTLDELKEELQLFYREL